MLTILVVSQYISSHVGGAERYIHEVTSRLDNRGMKILFLSSEGGDDLKVSLPFRVFSAGFHPLWPKQVDGILKKIQPDVVFAHFTVPGITDVVVRQAYKQKIPVCLAYHSDVTGPEWYRRILIPDGPAKSRKMNNSRTNQPRKSLFLLTPDPCLLTPATVKMSFCSRIIPGGGYSCGGL